MDFKLRIQRFLFVLVSALVFLLSSCYTTKRLHGNSYVYRSKQRTLEIIFENDSNCIIRNTFHCPDLPERYRIIDIVCNYSRSENFIYLTNRNPTKDSGLYMEMPAQESKRCSFLNKESRRQPKFTVGPKYATDFEKYGLIPNITNDTLKIIGNKILFFKKGEDRSIGFVFK